MMIRKMMVWVLVTGFWMGLCGISAAQQGFHGYKEYGVFIQDYSWTEELDDGTTLLNEDGPMFGLTGEAFFKGRPLGQRYGGELYYGEMDYEGHTFDGRTATSDVLHYGLKVYGDIVPVYEARPGVLLNAFLGLALDSWGRDIKDGKTGAGEKTEGCLEWWWCFYGRIGGGASYMVNNKLQLFADAGYKIPIVTREDVTLPSSLWQIVDDAKITLRPEQQPSPFARIGLRCSPLAVKVEYNTLRFDKSDPKTHIDLYQPRSESDQLSLKIEWTGFF